MLKAISSIKDAHKDMCKKSTEENKHRYKRRMNKAKRKMNKAKKSASKAFKKRQRKGLLRRKIFKWDV